MLSISSSRCMDARVEMPRTPCAGPARQGLIVSAYASEEASPREMAMDGLEQFARVGICNRMRVPTTFVAGSRTRGPGSEEPRS